MTDRGPPTGATARNPACDIAAFAVLMATLDGAPKDDSHARAKILAAEMLDESRVAQMQRDWKLRIRREGLATYAEYRRAYGEAHRELAAAARPPAAPIEASAATAPPFALPSYLQPRTSAPRATSAESKPSSRQRDPRDETAMIHALVYAGPAMPFVKARPVDAPATASVSSPRLSQARPDVEDINATAELRAIPQGPVLPFAEKGPRDANGYAASSGRETPDASPRDDRTPPTGPRDMLPGTSLLKSPETKLTIEQYASFCAEVTLHPERLAATLARYGFADDAARKHEDQQWALTMLKNEALSEKFRDFVATYRAYLERVGARSP